jgi:GNAT superfamily N-acetyltransferase
MIANIYFYMQWNMDIYPLKKKDIPAAAGLFIAGFKGLRQSFPMLPDGMEHPAVVSALIERLLAHSAGVAAYEDDHLLGYLGWWLVDGFRNSNRRAGYVPEWANAAVDDRKPAVYRALYRAAAEIWTKEGCNTHAITLLASDSQAIDTWFWNGFGLTVVDAVRGTGPLNPEDGTSQALPPEFTLHKASLADAGVLAELEREHMQHYARSPIYMVPANPNNEEEFNRFLVQPDNHAWLVFKDNEPAGYLRFEAKSNGAAEIVRGKGSTACTAAFLRPAYRGRGLTSALLESALVYFSSKNFHCCCVDFESFNPEAAAFWMRFFQPVCFSLVRVPENAK